MHPEADPSRKFPEDRAFPIATARTSATNGRMSLLRRPPAILASLWLAAVVAAIWPFPALFDSPALSYGIHLAGFFVIALALVGGIQAMVLGLPDRDLQSKNIGGHFFRLDHLRGIAAALVVVYHYYHAVLGNVAPSRHFLLNVLSEGSSGVDLFFVLSGFIFGVIGYGNRIRYWDFLVSRIVRIYPLYLFAILIVLCAYRGHYTAADGALFLVPFLDVGVLPGLPGFGQLWTIGLEFQFYLIFPFLMAFVARHGYRYLLALTLLFLALRAFYFAHAGSVQDAGYWTMLGRFDQFAAGMLASGLFLRRRAWFASPIHLILAVLAAIAGLNWLVHWGGYFNGADSAMWIVWPTIEGVFWAYLLVSYLSCTIRIPRWIDWPLSRLGEVSFSVYVMHNFAVVATVRYFGSQIFTGSKRIDATIAAIVVCVPLAAGISLLTFHLIEKQFFIFRRKYVVPIERAEPDSASVRPRSRWRDIGLPLWSAAAVGVACLVLPAAEIWRHDMQVGAQWVAYHPVEWLPKDAPAPDCAVRIDGVWTAAGIPAAAPACPLPGPAYGSWGGDESTGRLVFGPLALDSNRPVLALPVMVGPDASNLYVRLKQASGGRTLRTVALQKLTAHKWYAAAVDLSEFPGGTEITVEAIDLGHGWGQWLAVGNPRWIARAARD